MKYIVSLFIALSLFSCASFVPAEIENGKVLGVMPMQYNRISYQKTVTANATREDIFRQVRRWAAFHSSRTLNTGYGTSVKIPTPATALYIGDNLTGDIIFSGMIDPILKKPKSPLYWPATHYSTSIECYEGYYRVTLTNFHTFGLPSPHNLELRDKQTSKRVAKEYYQAVDEHVTALIAELGEFVKGEIKTTSN